MNYYAHSLEGQSKDKWQLLKDHLISVAKQTEKFAEKFKGSDFGFIAGLLHDIGKYSSEFQEKLEGKNNWVNHSIAGAKEAIKKYGNLKGKILAYSIAGHHAGLPDFTGTGEDSCLEYRLQNEMIPDYTEYKKEIDNLLNRNLDNLKLNSKNETEIDFVFYVFIKMVYSCLVDSDFLDTERFFDKEKALKRSNTFTLQQLEDKLNLYIKSNFSNPTTMINIERTKVLNTCLKKAESQPGFFSLTVPTGGGKTLSSLAFALKHARINNLERIIYVIPYTSIIEQNAKIFKEIFGDNCVLEHHSNYEYKDEDNENSIDYKMRLAAENWDMPIVVTTNVQFFESLFSNRPSRCRKIHNIINSIIILDEAQMLPNEYIKPCIYMLSELIKNYGCSVVFCTATQPALFDNPPEYLKLPQGMKPIEIIDNPKKLYIKLSAVKTSYIGELNNEQISNMIVQNEQVLCIVNSRKFARELYENLENKGIKNLYHLSAAMCPAHRTERIKEIKERLKNNEKCVVVSTQLIEAGVDIDFPVVYRELAGIDSIAQAAGRCNRERKIKEGGRVYVFKPVDRKPPAGFIARTVGVTKEVFDINKKMDLLSLKNIKYYFEKLYSVDADGLDGKNILRNIKNSSGRLEYPFKTIANDFNLIDNNTFSLVIRYDEKCEEILKDLNFTKYPWSYARKLQRYTVQVYKQDYDKLEKIGKVKKIRDIYFVVDKDAYSEEFGMNVQDSSDKVSENYIV